MATFAFRSVEDDLVVYVGGRAAPSDEEWQAYVRHTEDATKRWRDRSDYYKYFVFVDDGAPNAAQRARVLSAAEGLKGRASVVTAGLMARKIITAFGWLGAPMRGFSPLQLEAAAAFLELAPERLPLVIESARSLARLVGGVRAVDEIAQLKS